MKRVVIAFIIICALGLLLFACNGQKKETPTVIITSTPTIAESVSIPAAEITDSPQIIESKPQRYTDTDVEMLAKTVWGEARGCSSSEHRLVVWTILQRVDSNDFKGTSIAEIVTAKNQFMGYSIDYPIDPDIYALCIEELTKWGNGEEPPTHPQYAPTTPYYFFTGDGKHNYFRKNWR